MNSARWLLIVLLLWLGATIWSNALEPSKTSLLPANAITGSSEASAGDINELADPNLATAADVKKAIGWAGILVKALIFDYAWFDGWVIGAILRGICIIFSIAGLYFVLDILWKVRSVMFGG